MNFQSPCPAAIGASPAIPIQDPPPDPLPAIPREIGTPLHPTIDDSKAGIPVVPLFLLARSHPPAASRRAAAASSLAQLSPLFLTRRNDPWSSFLMKCYRERSLQDGSRFPFNRKRTILGHLPESAYVLRLASLHRVCRASMKGPDGPISSCSSASRKRSQMIRAGLPHRS